MVLWKQNAVGLSSPPNYPYILMSHGRYIFYLIFLYHIIYAALFFLCNPPHPTHSHTRPNIRLESDSDNEVTVKQKRTLPPGPNIIGPGFDIQSALKKLAMSTKPHKQMTSPDPRRSARSPEPPQSARSPEPRQSGSLRSPEPRQSASLRSPEPRYSARTPEPRQSARTPEPRRSEINPGTQRQDESQGGLARKWFHNLLLFRP